MTDPQVIVTPMVSDEVFIERTRALVPFFENGFPRDKFPTEEAPDGTPFLVPVALCGVHFDVTDLTSEDSLVIRASGLLQVRVNEKPYLTIPLTLLSNRITEENKPPIWFPMDIPVYLGPYDDFYCWIEFDHGWDRRKDCHGKLHIWYERWDDRVSAMEGDDAPE